MLFSNKKEHEVSVPRSAEEKEDKLPFRQLLVHLRDNLLTERVEFFMQNDTVYVVLCSRPLTYCAVAASFRPTDFRPTDPQCSHCASLCSAPALPAPTSQSTGHSGAD